MRLGRQCREAQRPPHVEPHSDDVPA
jgi:hypothetical protein